MELPEYFLAGYFVTGADHMSPDKRHGEQKQGDIFTIDDLLDFSNADASFDNAVANSTHSSAITAVDSCNSSISGGDNHFTDTTNTFAAAEPQFAGELCVPYEDIAELEWLSNFVEESFPAEDDELKTLHLISGVKPQTPECSSSSDAQNAPIFHSETPLPGKARSKRSRAAPGDWSTRLLPLVKLEPAKKRDGPNLEHSGRKCLHCAAEKTPQWRTGPMGPKTLCNACGVRYKSGRLVPEYRPAASPTFVSTKHSNSHRKVLELRRQNELQQLPHQHHLIDQSSIFGVSNGGDAYLIHHRNGPDFRHVM